jgi:hypothetical protein
LKIGADVVGDICILAGLGIVIYGAYLIYAPSGIILGGVGMVAVGFGLIRPHIRRGK